MVCPTKLQNMPLEIIMHVLDSCTTPDFKLRDALSRMCLVSTRMRSQVDKARYRYLDSRRLEIQDCRRQKDLAIQFLNTPFKLKILDFAHFSDCTDDDLKAITRAQPGLETLCLKAPKLTNEAVTALKPLTKLKELRVMQTSKGVLSNIEVKKLIHNHPNLKKLNLLGDLLSSPIEDLELMGLEASSIWRVLDGEDLPDDIKRLVIARWNCRGVAVLRLDVFEDCQMRGFLSRLGFLKKVMIAGEISMSVLEGLKSLPHLEEITVKDCHRLQNKVSFKDFASLRKFTIVSSSVRDEWFHSHINLSQLDKLSIQRCNLVENIKSYDGTSI